ncbi:hypothetical protein Leryth_013331 [Lithospermum erythrorhizon]|nr:hypothetical protein Leryth_013331 [Lithospermum erythrorhizon]
MEINAPDQSSSLRQKWVNLNSASQDGFAAPIKVIPLSKLTPSKRKGLALQLRSELEHIRLMQRKLESHRVNAASMMASGKKSGASGRNLGITGRSNSAKNTAVPNPATATLFRHWTLTTLFRQCDNLLKKLMSHQFGWVFNKPVDVVELKLHDYFDVIKHPMDFGTIKTKIKSDKYLSPLEFLADVRLTFSNAMTYNPPGSDVHIMADTVSKLFETGWKPIQKKLDTTSMGQGSVLHDEIEIVDPMAPCKKKRLSPPLEEVDHKQLLPEQSEVIPEQIKLQMTDEEKRILSRDLESSVDDLPENIIDFLKKQSSDGGEDGDEEIEIDIDALSADALFTLRRLLDELLQGKLVSTTKAETYEMELPNESGPSNSSMQLGKESDYADEDIDIGGNVPADSTNPTVEIEKESALISSQLCKAESIDDADSSSSSDSESDCPKTVMPTVPANSFIADDDGSKEGYNEKSNGEVAVDENRDSSPTESQLSPEKLYRAAILKDRFLDTILKAQEKTRLQDDKIDPEKMHREREQREMLKRKEKARLQAEAKAAEDARKRVEAKAATEAKRMRELEREAARQALLKMEKTVEINENSRFLEDLELLSGALPLEHHPSSIEETSPEDSLDGLGSFKFGGSNPLEQLGLYMKVDDEEEEPDAINDPNVANDVEEGEID